LRPFALANDFDRRVFAVPEIDLDEAALATRSRGLNAGILAVPEIDFDTAGFPGAPAVYFDSRSFVARRRIVTHYARIAGQDDQDGGGKKQASASRSGHWARQGHRDAKDAGKRFPLASLRAARKKGDFHSRSPAILV
jgi:hypothetical protein